MNKNPSLIEAKVSQPGEDFLTESSKSPASMGVFFVKQKALRKNLREQERQTGTRTRDLHLGKVAYAPTATTTIAYKIGKATDGTRTRDLHLGKVAYYQLYYYRI